MLHHYTRDRIHMWGPPVMDTGRLLNRLQQYLFVKLEEAAAAVSDMMPLNSEWQQRTQSNLCVLFYSHQMVKTPFIVYVSLLASFTKTHHCSPKSHFTQQRQGHTFVEGVAVSHDHLDRNRSVSGIHTSFLQKIIGNEKFSKHLV